MLMNIDSSLNDSDSNNHNNNYQNNHRLVELNLSCPNLVNKTIVAYDYETLDNYLNRLNDLDLKILKVGLKLPPYYEFHNFEKVANIIKKYPKNINFVTCINSVVNGLIVDPNKETTTIYPKNGFGGIGGICCKPTALSNVNQFYKLLGDKIDIIGCGGITNGVDIFEHILCGASAVQIGSQLMIEGPKCFDRLINEFNIIMEKKGYNNINQFKGKLITIMEGSINEN